MRPFALALLATFLTATVAVRAQDDVLTGGVVGVEYRRADAKEAFRKLFSAFNRSYALEIELPATVTVSLPSATLETALDKIAAAADVEVQLVDSVYQVRSKAPAVDVDFDGVDAVTALKDVFHKAKRQYRLSPGLNGRVAMRLKNARFSTAVAAIAEQIRAMVRIEDGVYLLEPTEDVGSSLPGIQYGTAFFVTRPVSLRVVDQDVRKVVSRLLRGLDQDFTLDPRIQGRVTIDLKEVPLIEALRQILEPAGGRVERQMCVIRILPRAKVSSNSVRRGCLDKRWEIQVPVNLTDAQPQAVLAGLFHDLEVPIRFDEAPQGTITLIPKSTWSRRELLTNVLRLAKVEARPEGNAYVIRSTDPEVILARRVARVEEESGDVREALRELFEATGTRFVIAPTVSGRVTVSAKNITLEHAIQRLTRPVDATYRVENGYIWIIPRTRCE